MVQLVMQPRADNPSLFDFKAMSYDVKTEFRIIR